MICCKESPSGLVCQQIETYIIALGQRLGPRTFRWSRHESSLHDIMITLNERFHTSCTCMIPPSYNTSTSVPFKMSLTNIWNFLALIKMCFRTQCCPSGQQYGRLLNTSVESYFSFSFLFCMLASHIGVVIMTRLVALSYVLLLQPLVARSVHA